MWPWLPPTTAAVLLLLLLRLLACALGWLQYVHAVLCCAVQKAAATAVFTAGQTRAQTHTWPRSAVKVTTSQL